ncbi:MAG: LDCC motif putative metal-binding protein [bacterium]
MFAWLDKYLKCLAAAGQKQFGDEAPDCCKLMKKQPQLKIEKK